MRVIKTGLALLLSLSLFGCSNNDIQISKEDALEVALDNEGLTEADITDTEIKKEEDSYKITFNTIEGSYIFKVGTNGTFRGKKFTPNETETSEEKKAEESSTNKATKPVVEKKKVDVPENIDKKAANEAYAAALAVLGIGDGYVKSVSLKEEGSNYVLRIKLTNDDGITYVVSVNKESLVVTQWSQE